MKKLLIIPMLFMCSMVIGQSKKIIGNPIKIENLEVAQHDFPNRMTGDDAKAACAKLGEGWRLPTKDELNLLYENKGQIGHLGYWRFWSSTESRTETNGILAFEQDFSEGSKYSGHQYHDEKSAKYSVRAVRDF
jgi:hypothetical protein